MKTPQEAALSQINDIINQPDYTDSLPARYSKIKAIATEAIKKWEDSSGKETGMEFWTEEMILRYAELYRWSSGRITMKGFKESPKWQNVDIKEAKEFAVEVDESVPPYKEEGYVITGGHVVKPDQPYKEEVDKGIWQDLESGKPPNARMALSKPNNKKEEVGVEFVEWIEKKLYWSDYGGFDKTKDFKKLYWSSNSANPENLTTKELYDYWQASKEEAGETISAQTPSLE